MKTNPARDVTAILVNYNGGSMNEAAIDSLIADGCTSIVFVDNDSADGSTEMVERRYGSSVNVLRMGFNSGFSRACNAGAARATTPYLLFFNNDAATIPGMTATLAQCLNDDPTVGIAGPAVLEARAPNVVQSTGYSIDRWGFPVDPTAGIEVEDLPAAPARDVFFVSGCALMIRKSLFDALDGFDPGMFMFVEDVDLCWRTWLQGLRVVTLRAARCVHEGGGTATVGKHEGAYRTSSFRIREREHNAFRMMYADLGTAALVRYLLLYFPVTVLESVAWLLLGKRWIAEGYFQAFRKIASGFGSIRRRREAVQRARRCGDEVLRPLWSRRYEKLFFARRNGVPASANRR